MPLPRLLGPAAAVPPAVLPVLLAVVGCLHRRFPGQLPRPHLPPSERQRPVLLQRILQRSLPQSPKRCVEVVAHRRVSRAPRHVCIRAVWQAHLRRVRDINWYLGDLRPSGKPCKVPVGPGHFSSKGIERQPHVQSVLPMQTNCEPGHLHSAPVHTCMPKESGGPAVKLQERCEETIPAPGWPCLVALQSARKLESVPPPFNLWLSDWPEDNRPVRP